MDLGSASIGAIILAICIIPFVLMRQSRLKKQKEMLQKLTQLAATQNSVITQYEFGGHYIIGIDEKKNILFFYNPKATNQTEQTIILSHFQACKVNNKSKKAGTEGNTQTIIEAIQLCFVPKTAGKPDAILEFYNTQIAMQLSGEVQAAEKWSKLINNIFKAKN